MSKTKWIPFVPPEVDTIYDPPLKIKVDNIERNLLVYCARNTLSYVCEDSSFSSNFFNGILVEVPVETRRMFWSELITLLNRGWVWRDTDGRVRNYASVDESNFDNAVYDNIKVLRLNDAGAHWIEPTTDLLEEK